MTKNPAMIFYSKKIEEEEKNTDPFPAFFSGFSIVVQTDHGTRNDRTYVPLTTWIVWLKILRILVGRYHK